MVHGAFCGGWVFDGFRVPFEAAGHAVTAPDLRGHADDAQASAVVGVSMSDYARDLIELVREQPAPPLLVGHSMGGLVAMMAAARTEIAGLSLLAPSPPGGIAGGKLEEAGSAMALYSLGAYWTQAIEPDRHIARLYSLDRMDAEAGRAVARRMRPESGRAMFETLNWWLDPMMTTSIGRIAAPALALAGERDLINPPSTVRQIAAQLRAPVEVFPAMSHWLIGEPGWEKVAKACLDWIAVALNAAA
jgi:pimeloyl-ACP methyl ester carboxylesterase